MKVKCKYYDEMGNLTCKPYGICRNPWIKEKAQGNMTGFDEFTPDCPFINTAFARVYCVKFESNVKYYITNGDQTVISGPFGSRGLAQQFINVLRIEEYE